MKLKSEFIVRRMGPTCIAVPFGALAGEIGGMITLSESGALLWQAMEQGCDGEAALAGVLRETYEVSEEEALRDVRAFLDGLYAQGALEA